MDGQIIGGDFTAIKVRQKSNSNFEIGELLVCDNPKIIYRIFDLQFSSQISGQNLELISGLTLEKNIDHNLIEEDLRNYITADLQPLMLVEDERVQVCKIMPRIFSPIRRIIKPDLDFMAKEYNADSMCFGNIRSGSKELDVPIFLNGRDVYSHHILITATTGKGKSNLVKNLLFDSLNKSFVANLVLDPHNEYFGSTAYGLKDHSESSNYLKFFSNNKVASNIMVNSLRINLRLIEPTHMRAVTSFSDAQWEAIHLAFARYEKEWIIKILNEQFVTDFVAKKDVHEDTYKVIKRKLTNVFGVRYTNGNWFAKGIFTYSETEGMSFVEEVIKFIEKSNTVVIDTSSVSSAVEILIGSLLVSDIFSKYKYYKMNGELSSKPIVNVVLEEAPRVLGNEVLKKGSNIFDTIAREGRKFKVGLTAITQLPSLIPKTILANMNTKIILGTENSGERSAIIDSAAHDLSKDHRTIASLDKGEAILSSNFAKFAIPIKIPLIDNTIKKQKEKHEAEKVNSFTNHKVAQTRANFGGMELD